MSRPFGLRRVALPLLLGMVLLGPTNPGPVLAWSASCQADSPNAPFFAGNYQLSNNNVSGSRVKLEYSDPTLCTSPSTSETSFSSAWTSIVGSFPTFSVNNIY